MVEGWGGLGHEQLGLKVLVSRGHESRVGVHTRIVRFSVEMYGAWRSGSAWTDGRKGCRGGTRGTKGGRVQAFVSSLVSVGVEVGLLLGSIGCGRRGTPF